MGDKELTLPEMLQQRRRVLKLVDALGDEDGSALSSGPDAGKDQASHDAFAANEDIMSVDPNFFSVLGYRLLRGDPATVLADRRGAQA